MEILIGKNGAGKTKYIEEKYFNGERLSSFELETSSDGKSVYFPASSLLKELKDDESCSFYNYLKLKSSNMAEANGEIGAMLGSMNLNKVFPDEPSFGGYGGVPGNWMSFDHYWDRYFAAMELGQASKDIRQIHNNFIEYMKATAKNGRILLSAKTPEEWFTEYIDSMVFIITFPASETLDMFSAKICTKRPWKNDLNRLNSLLDKIDLGIKLSIEETSSTFTEKVSMRFIKDGQTLKFKTLSTGEKTLFNLILQIFLSGNTEKMKTIILDEVTAFLNPISQKRLINGLWDLGEDITLITHSPVTVSLFNRAEFKLVGNGSIKSVNTREAMSILLKDTPDLVVKDVGDINVFAEAKNDAKFYAWQIKGSDQNLNISSISTQKIKDDSIIEVDGGTTQIDNITKSLIGLETLSIAFIKDFDGVNKTDKKKRVFVNDERYSLENYIFDPYLVGFILGEDHTEKFNQIFEGDSKETEYEVDGQIIKKKLPKTFTDVKIKDSLWLKYCHDIGYRPLEDFNKLRAASFYFKSIQLLFKDIS